MSILKKNGFERLALRTIGKLFSAQITGAAIYLLMVSLTVILFSDEDGHVKQVFELLPLLGGVLVTLRLVYIHMYALGEGHHTAGAIVRKPKAPIWGLYVGLGGISPILLFWILMIFGFLFSYSVAGLQTVVGYFLYPWSPYFNIVRGIVPASSFWGVLFYIPPMLPIPLVSYVAFRDGIEGRPYRYRFWEKERYKNQPNGV